MARNHSMSRLLRAPRNASFAPEVETTGTSSNRIRKTSLIRGQSAPVSKHIRIHQSPIEIDEDEGDKIYRNSDEDEGGDSDCIEIKPPPRTDHCHSLSTIPDRLQGLVRRAQIEITNHTLFTMPFLSLVEVLFLLADAWERAQDKERKYEAKTKAVDTYVSISCQ